MAKRKVETTEEQRELKAHVRRLEREVKRLFYGRKRIAIRRFVARCPDRCWLEVNGFHNEMSVSLLIDRPVLRHCQRCGQELEWEQINHD